MFFLSVLSPVLTVCIRFNIMFSLPFWHLRLKPGPCTDTRQTTELYSQPLSSFSFLTHSILLIQITCRCFLKQSVWNIRSFVLILWEIIDLYSVSWSYPLALLSLISPRFIPIAATPLTQWLVNSITSMTLLHSRNEQGMMVIIATMGSQQGL